MMITHGKRRWAVAGLLAAVVAGVALTSLASAGAQTARTTTPRCGTRALEVWIGVGGGGGQAGGIAYPLEFTNVTDHACYLQGFPGVSAQLNGHQVGSAAQRDHAVAPQLVTLPAGKTAHAMLTITDVSALSGCNPVTADGLGVYPPDAFAAADVPFRFRACSTAGPSFLSIQVVEPRVGVPGHS
jgi:hypothetical protein